MFHVDPTGMVGNVDYSRFARMLPEAKRVQREGCNPPTDFSGWKPQYKTGKTNMKEPSGARFSKLARGGLSAGMGFL